MHQDSFVSGCYPLIMAIFIYVIIMPIVLDLLMIIDLWLGVCAFVILNLIRFSVEVKYWAIT